MFCLQASEFFDLVPPEQVSAVCGQMSLA